jgi:site-specific recombinase XerD
MEVEVPVPSRRLPDTRSEDEIRRYYEAVWQARNVGDMVPIKTLLYTGVRVSELIRIKRSDTAPYSCYFAAGDSFPPFAPRPGTSISARPSTRQRR